MLRAVSAALRGTIKSLASPQTSLLGEVQSRCISAVPSKPLFDNNYNALVSSGFGLQSRSLSTLGPKPIINITQNGLPSSQSLLKVHSVLTQPVRTQIFIKFDRKKGKRQSEPEVLKRFFRLNWGMWIRTIAGRHKHLWRKRPHRKMRMKRHVFCNATQCTLLDKMVTRRWRRPMFFVDDPYAPYQSREDFIFTRKAPVIPTRAVPKSKLLKTT